MVNYDPSAPIEVSYTTPFEGEPLGKDHPELLYHLKASHGHDMAIVNGIGRIGYMKGGGKALWKDENIADSLTMHAIDFINNNKNRPFFLYLATNDVHGLTVLRLGFRFMIFRDAIRVRRSPDQVTGRIHWLWLNVRRTIIGQTVVCLVTCGQKSIFSKV